MPIDSENEPRVAVVGFGYIGCVIGAVLADRGLSVVGIDTSPEVIRAVSGGRAPVREPGLDNLVNAGVARGRLTVTSDIAAAAECDVVLITVGTPLGEDGAADMRSLESAVTALSHNVADDALVIVKSTVPPLTTETLVAPGLRARAPNVRVAFCPERLAEGAAIREFLSIPMVVGGVDAESAEAAMAFWRRSLGVDVIDVGSARAAELVKLADNAWIDLNIAFAHELARLSDALSLDVLQVIRAANTLPKGMHHVNILTPSLGVGGYCLTKDPWFLHAFGARHGAEMQLPRLSRLINDTMPHYAASLIDEHLRAAGTGRGEGPPMRVAVLGLAFKNNTGDCRFTPTMPAIVRLAELGYEVVAFDPWVSAEDAEAFSDCRRAGSIEDAVAGADCVAFFAGHEEFRAFPLERLADLAAPAALVFDGRMFFSQEQITDLRDLGLSYKGVGR